MKSSVKSICISFVQPMADDVEARVATPPVESNASKQTARQALVKSWTSIRVDVDPIALNPVGAQCGRLVHGHADARFFQPFGQAEATQTSSGNDDVKQSPVHDLPSMKCFPGSHVIGIVLIRS